MTGWMAGWWMDGQMDGFYAGYINSNQKVQLELSIILFSWSFSSDFPPALHYKTTAKWHLLALRVSLSVALSTYWLSWSLKSAAHSDSNCVIIIFFSLPMATVSSVKKDDNSQDALRVTVAVKATVLLWSSKMHNDQQAHLYLQKEN